MVSGGTIAEVLGQAHDSAKVEIGPAPLIQSLLTDFTVHIPSSGFLFVGMFFRQACPQHTVDI